jgi:hypothetical protein
MSFDRHALLRTRALVAAGHGYPSWNSLTQDIVNDRLFDAIPINWINDAVGRLVAGCCTSSSPPS